MTKMKKIFTIALLFLCPAALGCAGWQKQVLPVISEAAAYVSDAQQVVDIARSIVQIWFLAHPSPEKQARVERALAECARGIDVALRLTKGAEDLSQEQLDAAWTEFKAAYRELLVVMQDAGVVNAGRLGAGTPPMMPTPLAMRGQI